MPSLDPRGRSRRALGVLVLSLGLGTAALAGPANAAGTAPSAPRHVSATVSGHAVTVRWAAPGTGPKVTGYSVGYSGGQFGDGETVGRGARSDVFRNLGPGTYAFSVAAENAAGEGKRVFVVVNVGKHKGPSLGADQVIVLAGHQATFFGIWKPGTKVTLDRKLPGGRYHALATMTVGREAFYTRTLTLVHNALYRTRTGSGLTSNVAKVLTRSRMNLTAALDAPATYTLSGTVAPASKGQAVTVSYSVGHGYVAVGTAHTDARGHWSFTHTYPVATAYTFKAAAAKTTTNLANLVTKRVPVA